MVGRRNRVVCDAPEPGPGISEARGRGAGEGGAAIESWGRKGKSEPEDWPC